MSKKLAKDIDKAIQDNTSNGVPTIVKVNVTKQRVKIPANVMLFQTFAYLAAVNLKPATLRALMYLFSLSEYENYIGIDVSTMAENLDMSERSILRAMKELEDNNIVMKFKHPTDKRRNDYFINPTASWKGNGFTRKESINKLNDVGDNQLEMFNQGNVKKIG